MKTKRTGGYTLVELIVSVGLFALVMTLAAGAYLIVIGVNRQTQAISSGIDTLSFALETMTRTIRTGSAYSCSTTPHTDCSGGGSFYLNSSSGKAIIYSVSNGVLTQTTSGIPAALNDSSINITSLKFYATGTQPGDTTQARVTIVVSGTVSSGPGKTVSFTVETGATMRGSDI